MFFRSYRQKLRSSLQEAFSAGETLAERLARAEVDDVIQTRVPHILIPILVVVGLFIVAEFLGNLIGADEARRIAVTTVVLAAGLYGLWAIADGAREALPVVAVWVATGLSPYNLARLVLYRQILVRFRETFSTAEGRPTTTSYLARTVLRFADSPATWDALAFRLADRIAPRLVSHALLRVVLVLAPVIAAWAYYRFFIFPDLIQQRTGLGPWRAFLYPLAALVDALAGTELRQALLAPAG